jgi:hypothetical protein
MGLFSFLRSVNKTRYMPYRTASTTDLPEEAQEKIRVFRQKHFGDQRL